MDSSTAGGSAATGCTVGGRSMNFSGCRGRPPKKPSFARDDRLAQDGTRSMTGPFRPPSLLLLPAAPAAVSASTVAAVGRPAFPYPAAAAGASGVAVDLTTFSDVGDDNNSNGSGSCKIVVDTHDDLASMQEEECEPRRP